ncbi:MAG: asparagine synthase-related protein [Candidatus Acidiferrales bacterium]
MNSISGLCFTRGRIPPDQSGGDISSLIKPLDDTPVQKQSAPNVMMVATGARPAIGQSDDAFIAFTGRLDNIFELAEGLPPSVQHSCKFSEQPTSFAASVISHHYAKEGSASLLNRMIGDFALAIWDPRRKRLVLARDPVGTVTLFYCAIGDFISWSSSLDYLLKISRITPTIDDQYVADFLLRETDLVSTPFREFRQVCPGEEIVFEPGKQDSRRYWKVDPSRSLTYKNDVEYQSQFLELFGRSLKRRMRDSKVVAAELSGGFDSSSIICVANSLKKDSGGSSAHDVRTVSFIYDLSQTANESHYIDVVEQALGVQGLHIRESQWQPDLPPDAAYMGAIPRFAMFYDNMFKQVVDFMKSIGSNVLLRGTGGDHLMWSQVDFPPQLPDLLRQLRLIDLHKGLRDWGISLQLTYWSLLSESLRRCVAGHRTRFLRSPNRLSQVLHREIRRRRYVVDEWKQLCQGRCGSVARGEQIKSLFGAILAVAIDNYRPFQIEVSFPYLDRDLIEFCLAVPISRLIQPASTRVLHKHAMKDILPAKLLARRGKATSDEIYGRTLARLHPQIIEMFKDSIVISRGYVEKAALDEEIARIPYGNCIDMHLLLRVVSLEAWFRGYGLPFAG